MLTNNHKISFGCASIAGLYKPVNDVDAHDVLNTAWNAGIRYFDTAPHYGNGVSERRVGDFLRDKSDWLISTKVGRILTPDPIPLSADRQFRNGLPFKQAFDFSYDAIMRSVEDSFQRLGLNKIDILYVHDIGDFEAGTDTQEHRQQLLTSGHLALSELKRQGVVSAIGLGVNTVEICEELIGQMEIDLILLAGRYTLLEQAAETRLFPLLETHAIKLVIGGVFNSGILAIGPIDGAHYNYAPAPLNILERVRKIETICARHNVPMAAAALQYPAKSKFVASTLIGTSRAKQLLRNIEQFQMPLPDALWNDLKQDGIIS